MVEKKYAVQHTDHNSHVLRSILLTYIFSFMHLLIDIACLVT